jgi:hypothetical protein
MMRWFNNRCEDFGLHTVAGTCTSPWRCPCLALLCPAFQVGSRMYSTVPFHDEQFRRFLRQRQILNERMDKARAEIDAWIESHGEHDPEPSLADIALLEALLQTRTELCDQLSKVFDEYVNHLLEIRRRAEESKQ